MQASRVREILIRALYNGRLMGDPSCSWTPHALCSCSALMLLLMLLCSCFHMTTHASGDLILNMLLNHFKCWQICVAGVGHSHYLCRTIFSHLHCRN
jgi:hypothetical protein